MPTEHEVIRTQAAEIKALCTRLSTLQAKYEEINTFAGSQLENMLAKLQAAEKEIKRLNGALSESKRRREVAVSDTKYMILQRRFLHLLESKFISSFDEYDRRKGGYKKDIAEADAIAYNYEAICDRDLKGDTP